MAAVGARNSKHLSKQNSKSYRALEVAIIGRQVGLVRVDKPIAYLDIDDTGLVEAGYGPRAERVTV
jgi:hypothetical protein